MTEDKRLENDGSEGPSAPEPESTPEPRVTPPGELLKQAREAARLSEQDVARELRMTVSKVRYLEADAYEKLHSDTFVRGYLRTYAKVLDVDPAEILEAYTSFRRSSGWGEEAKESPIQASIPEPAKPLWRFAVWILVLLVGLWALSVWFLGNRQAPVTESSLADPLEEMTQQAAAPEEERGFEQPQEDVMAEQEPSAEALVQGEEAQGEGSTEQTSATENSELSGGQAAVNPNVEALAATDTRSRAAYGEPELLDQLRLEFSDECWVEVVDARGDVLQANLLQPGRVLTLSGEAPFNVKLGNAHAVSLQLNGEPYFFDMPARGRPLTLSVE